MINYTLKNLLFSIIEHYDNKATLQQIYDSLNSLKINGHIGLMQEVLIESLINGDLFIENKKICR